MQIVTLDFETYWSTDFSLSKISFIEYINSPQFETISVALKINDDFTQVFFGESAVTMALKSIDWENTACVAHNGNEFDFPLLVWKFDCHPKKFIDTLALAKAKHQSEVGGSLATLSKHYGLPEKNSAALLNTKGKRLVDFTQAELAAMEAYNRTDTDNAYALAKTFLNPDFAGVDDLLQVTAITQQHQKEIALCDMTARMTCYPKLRADVALMHKTLDAVEQDKSTLLQRVAKILGVLTEEEARAELASSARFAEVLRALGVDPPTKESPTTGKQIFALAKTDEAFTALLEHEDPNVQALAAARLGVRSTILETRLQKMIACSAAMGGLLPVTLGYHAATTGRWGGRIWNPQNLPRINKKVPKLTDALRKSLIAPPGHKLVVVDSSNIELRVNHWLWGVKSTQDLFEADPKADLYRDFAARTLFNTAPDLVTPDQRQLAKVAQLGLGFGAGPDTFIRVAKMMAGLVIDPDTARRVVEQWRARYTPIQHGWWYCGRALVAMASGASGEPLGATEQVRVMEGASLLLPSGRRLYYPWLTRKVDQYGRTNYEYGVGRGKSFINGPRLCENIVQAIARDVLAEQALIVQAKTGCAPVLMVHDELVYVVPEADAEAFFATVNAAMRTTPKWAPDLILWSEGGISESYGDAK